MLYIDKNTNKTLRVSPGTSLRRPGHYGGTAAINGNWYNNGSAFFFGYSISSGVALGNLNNDGRLGFIGDDTSNILRIGHYQDIGGTVPPNAWNMVSGQTLVVASAPWGPTTTASTDPTFTHRHPRTAVGTTPEGYLIWTVIDGRSYGPSLTGTETATLLVDLGVHRGLMMDGGGSSAMYVDGHGIVNQPSDGSTRSAGNQLIFDARADWVECAPARLANEDGVVDRQPGKRGALTRTARLVGEGTLAVSDGLTRTAVAMLNRTIRTDWRRLDICSPAGVDMVDTQTGEGMGVLDVCEGGANAREVLGSSPTGCVVERQRTRVVNEDVAVQRLAATRVEVGAYRIGDSTDRGV